MKPASKFVNTNNNKRGERRWHRVADGGGSLMPPTRKMLITIWTFGYISRSLSPDKISRAFALMGRVLYMFRKPTIMDWSCVSERIVVWNLLKALFLKDFIHALAEQNSDNDFQRWPCTYNTYMRTWKRIWTRKSYSKTNFEVHVPIRIVAKITLSLRLCVCLWSYVIAKWQLWWIIISKTGGNNVTGKNEKLINPRVHFCLRNTQTGKSLSDFLRQLLQMYKLSSDTREEGY